MEDTTLPAMTLSDSPVSPCMSNEAIARTEDGAVEDAMQQWLENEVFPGFRVWQLAGIVLSILLSIVIGLCCCIRFRVPRTKQEIEADYIRKRITKSFRRELSKISNTEMDEMDLQKGNGDSRQPDSRWHGRYIPRTLVRSYRESKITSFKSQLWTEFEESSRGTQSGSRRSARICRSGALSVAFDQDSTRCSAGCVCASVSRASTAENWARWSNDAVKEKGGAHVAN